MKAAYPLLVIGAGPAGMAAAQTAAKYGVEVAVIDQQAQPGGQIYRNVDSSLLNDPSMLGKDYTFGKPLVQAFRRAGLDYHAATSVWYLDKNRRLGILKQGENYQLSARKIVIANGAQERPMPLPGWQLPGVMTAGAGQILLKSAALVPRDDVVLAGNGPLMLLVAWQYLQAGVRIGALLDTTPRGALFKALRHLPKALGASDYLWRGLRLMASIRHAGVPTYKAVSDLRAIGDGCLQAVSFSAAGKSQRIETELLLLHQGIVPALHITQAAGCDLCWNEAQQCWRPAIDAWGESSRAGIFVAGDGAGIVGARAASLDGQLAGLQVAHQLGRITAVERDRLAQPIRKAADRHRSIRPFLDACYPVADALLAPPDDTLLCRCEEIDAADVRAVVRLGCVGPNQAKAFLRCGMGPCQGRFCGSTVEQIFAHERGISVSDVGRFSVRPPLQPITLGQLAGIQDLKED